MIPATLIILCLAFARDARAESSCSYDTWQWNTLEKRAVNFAHIVHPYNEISEDERDPVTGCTVCIEDQLLLTIPPLEPFYLCRRVAGQMRAALERAIEAGAMVESVVGYRVGRTRGDIDADGNRTGFSNHSFGIALDINPQHNGLYDDCVEFGPQCVLMRGGAWRPNEARQSIKPHGMIVRSFRKSGFLWGGQIRGKQKDFMHFSPTGY